MVIHEYWDDADGPHVVDLTGLIQPIARDVGPFQEQVVQEEGVPVGGV